ncbi:MAG: hypothetical protein QG666_175, partial [Euryarchaeota archaeon]|nr:hypothetical protein [Euryarchaeota archaeon]
MRSHLAAFRDDPAHEVEGLALIISGLVRQAEDEIDLGHKAMVQSKLACPFDLLPSVSPANAVQDREAAGLATETDAFVCKIGRA